jgi:ubiquinol-cytochrome c reductase cytochrome b subunit
VGDADVRRRSRLRGGFDGLSERVPGLARVVRGGLRYAFPEHWSFLLGEIALYAFVLLVATGVYLTFFFDPSVAPTVYHGTYEPLQGVRMSKAYASTVGLSLNTRAGLLVRQTHHWAALVFVAAITMHMFRLFFTGAFRKPRDLNWTIGLTMLTLAVLEGFLGYSLPDDLLSGMGLAIAYSVAVAIPLVGGFVASHLWDGQFPGSGVIEERLYSLHILVLPIVLGALIGLHLALVALQKHTDFRGPRRTETEIVGSPLWPTYALRSGGLLLATTGVLVLLGGLVQINPIWLWGPYEPSLGTNGAQPDWYLGWLIGALRLMPSFEIHAFGHTLVPNPFFGGILFPTVVFGLLYAWPAIERRVTGDAEHHNLLDRPRDNPWRSGCGAALFAWVTVIFLAGSADRFFITFGIDYGEQVWIFRALVVVVPVVAFLVTRRICRELAERDLAPLSGFTGERVERTPDGGFVRR